MNRSRSVLTVLGGAMIALALACGSDDKRTDAYGARQPDAAGGGVLNLSQSTSNLLALKSYRFDLLMALDLGAALPSGSGAPADALGEALAGALLGALGEIKVEGAYVAPDSVDVTVMMFGQQLRFVRIGDEAWTNEGGGWRATPATGMDFGFGGSPTELVADILPQEVLQGAKTSDETVNGVKTTRYSYDKEALAQLSEDLGQSADLEDVTEANIDIWLAQGDIPVRVLVSIASANPDGQQMSLRLELNVRDIDNSSIEIKPPV